MIILNRIKDINGRALMRMNDEKLQIIGIENSSHRYEILKEIYKQVYIFFLFYKDKHVFVATSLPGKTFQRTKSTPFGAH